MVRIAKAVTVDNGVLSNVHLPDISEREIASVVHAIGPVHYHAISPARLADRDTFHATVTIQDEDEEGEILKWFEALTVLDVKALGRDKPGRKGK